MHPCMRHLPTRLMRVNIGHTHAPTQAPFPAQRADEPRACMLATRRDGAEGKRHAHRHPVWMLGCCPSAARPTHIGGCGAALGVALGIAVRRPITHPGTNGPACHSLPIRRAPGRPRAPHTGTSKPLPLPPPPPKRPASPSSPRLFSTAARTAGSPQSTAMSCGSLGGEGWEHAAVELGSGFCARVPGSECRQGQEAICSPAVLLPRRCAARSSPSSPTGTHACIHTPDPAAPHPLSTRPSWSTHTHTTLPNKNTNTTAPPPPHPLSRAQGSRNSGSGTTTATSWERSESPYTNDWGGRRVEVLRRRAQG